MTDVLNLGLGALIVALATWAVLARDAFAAVVGFIAYGLLLTLVWVQLHGVDVALTEAAIGGGLTGALLIGAASRLRGTEAAARAERPQAFTRVVAAAGAAAVTATLALCVLTLPEPAPTLAPQTAANIAVTGVGNPITAVLLAFRAMDTLLEAIVLVFALVGVWSLGPDDAWGGHPGPRHRARPQRHPRVSSRACCPRSASSSACTSSGSAPTILAASSRARRSSRRCGCWSSWRVSRDAPPIGRTWVRVGLVAGPLVFIAIGLVGAAAAGAFLAYPDGLAKPLIVVIELALMPTLALILALLLTGAPERPVRR